MWNNAENDIYKHVNVECKCILIVPNIQMQQCVSDLSANNDFG